MIRQVARIAAGVLAAAVLGSLGWATLNARAVQPAALRRTPQAVRDRAARTGRVRVLVQLRSLSDRHIPEGQLSTANVLAQRNATTAARGRLLALLPRGGHRVVRQFATVPYVALEVSSSALPALDASTDVVRIMEDQIVPPTLMDTIPSIQADQVWATGFDGTGTTIAILDTGIEAHHAFFGGRVTQEACYSSTVLGISASVCPDGQDIQVGAGSAAPCLQRDCLHGTHVAGIAAGSGALAGQPFSGVARNAQIMAVQVFSHFTDSTTCGGPAECARAYSSDIIAGLEYVYSLAPQYHVAAVNLSLGGGAYGAYCDDQPYKAAIDNLRSIGVPTIIAAGNGGQTAALSSPGCISSAISVGSVDKNDTISGFSNVAPFLSLLAPGGTIFSSVPGGDYETLSGTSMAAPHVTGTWALLRQAAPTATVDEILNALRQTGRPVMDLRFGGTEVVPRIRAFQALASLTGVSKPLPTLTSVLPSRVRSGQGPITLTLVGKGFDAFTTVVWHGAPQSTTVLSSTMLQATIAASDLTGTTALVSVTTPGPGGGSSLAKAVTIDAAAMLSTNTLGVPPGQTVTVTIGNGPLAPNDWLALAQTGASNRTYVQMIYAGSLGADRRWAVTMPMTAGTYEFRLFLDNGFTRAATSPAVTVGP